MMIFVQGFLRRGDMTDSVRVWWKSPELSDRLTMLVIVGTKSAEHSLKSHVETNCLHKMRRAIKL